MIEYTQFNPKTGQILKSGLCQDEVFSQMENVILGKIDVMFLNYSATT